MLWCWTKRIRTFEKLEIKLDVNNDVFSMDMWLCLDDTGQVFSPDRDSEEIKSHQRARKTSGIAQK